MKKNKTKQELIFLFGAGGAASWVYQGFSREGIRIAGFLDDSADGIAKVASIPVFAPDDPSLSISLRKEALVVFCVMNPNVNESEIRSRLYNIGWKRVQTFSEYGQSEILQTGRTCCMIDGRSFDSHSNQLQAARALLSDEHSSALFDAFLNFCRTLEDAQFPSISKNPYFPLDLPRWPKKLRMIDCGAYDGDSLRAAQRRGYIIEESISFEPDLFNFGLLAKNITSIPRAMAFPCGVCDQTKMLRFTAQGDTGSSVSKQGEIFVQGVAMDQAIPHFSPNLIKIDIEGSEESALKGAAHLIKKYRPGLAVSVYHLPTDIWRIPLYLSQLLGPKTRFYLRRHSRTIADTVLYVFPKKRKKNE